ncbi:MAG TPA: hypothetical protein VHJ34_00220, partial [Actinomycetota bacterium]|nr:hypothetical protein [Actinomycetota bacterium]
MSDAAVAALVLGHAALGALCLLLGPLPRVARGRAVAAVALAGVALGVALVVARTTGETWRSVRLEPAGAAAAGAAAACAWLLVAAAVPSAERWRAGALTGAGAAGLAAFATGAWAAPALLFWTCASLAAA